MVNIEKYLSLPETVESAELRPMFLELLRTPVVSAEDSVLIVRALEELADRQWHNYELIAVDLRELITDWVISHWNTDSMVFVVNATAVVGRLGLAGALPVIEKSLDKCLAREVRDNLVEWLREAKPRVVDPYSGMR